MNIADVFFSAQLDDSKLQVSAVTQGDKAGATLGGHISASMAKTAFVGFAANAGATAFGMLKDAVGSVTEQVGEFVTKAREEEVVSSRLNTALAANVVGYNGNRDAIDAFIQAQTSYGFTVSDVTAQMAQLVAATGNVTKAQEYLSTAEDLARLTGNDLATSVDALTRVNAGSSKVLKGLGINLGKNATSTMALAAVQKIASGQAKAFGETSQGAMDKFAAKIDSVQIKIGQKLIPVINDLADGLSLALDLLGNPDPYKNLVDQTKAFLAQNVAVGTLKDSLKNAQEQQLELSKVFGMESAKRSLQEVIDLLVHQIDLESGSIPIVGSMGEAAYQAFSRMQTGAQDAQVAVDQVEAFRQEAIYAKIAADQAAPKITAFFDVFDVAIGKGNIAQDTIDLHDNKVAVDDARDARDKFKKGSPAWIKANDDVTIAVGKAAAAAQQLRDDEVKLYLTKPDPKTKADLMKYFSTLGLGVTNLTGDLKLAWDAMFGPDTGLLTKRDVTTKYSVTTGKGGKTGFAAGGWVGLNGPQMVLVGEQGPEWVISNDKLGDRLPLMNSPHGGGGSGGGGTPVAAASMGGNTYQVNVQGLLRARTASEIGDNLRRLADFGVLAPRDPS